MDRVLLGALAKEVVIVKVWVARKEYAALKNSFDNVLIQRLDSYDRGTTDSGAVLAVESNPWHKRALILLIAALSSAVLGWVEPKELGSAMITLMVMLYVIVFQARSRWRYEKQSGTIHFKKFVSQHTLLLADIDSMQVTIKRTVYAVTLVGKDKTLTVYDPYLDNLLPLIKILTEVSPKLLK